MKKETKIIVGVLAGAALGATIALVLSSDSKDELKGKVSDWFCDLLDSSKDKLSDLKDKASSVAEKVKDSARSTVENVRDNAIASAERVRENVSEHIQNRNS
jgi:gas vesicle protein